MLFEEAASFYEKLEGVSSRLEMIDILTEMFKKSTKDDIKETIYMTQGILAPPFYGIEIGMAEKMVAQAIEVSYGYSKKEVESNFKKTGDLGNTAEYFSCRSRMKRMSHAKFTLKEVFMQMQKIANTSGAGSQDAKVRMLSQLFAASTQLEARYIARFAIGALRLGAGDATILEALSKAYTGTREYKSELENAYNICSDLGSVGYVLLSEGKKGIENFKVSLFSPIRPALAERVATSEEILEKMHGICAVESKYDGFRAQVHMDRKHKRVEIFSRRLENTTKMFPELCEAALKEVDAEEAIFEGEAIVYNQVSDEFLPFQETIQRKRKHGIEEKSRELPLTIFSFDIMYLDGKDLLNKPYIERRKMLENIIGKNGTISISDMAVVDSAKKLDMYFNDAISRGLEGVVAKDLNSSYVAGARKFSWIKLKRSYKGELSDTLDLVIVGYYLGKGQRTNFKFGGLLCATYNDSKDVFETVTRIGTGFSEKQMKVFEDLLNRIKGKKNARVVSVVEPDFWVEPKYVVTVKADEITRSPMHTCGAEGEGTGYALRFPRLISDGIRDDKSAEDATTSKEVISMYKMQKKGKMSDKL